jgi:hypothetical protein
MSDILDQLARIRVLLREQAEDCAQHVKYEQERLEVADKQRAETDTKKAELREKLEKIIKGREEIQTRDRTVECEFDFNCTNILFDSPVAENLDAIIRLLRENHDGRMEAIQKFIKGQ